MIALRFQAIADCIFTVIPWAWKEIKTSFNGIVSAVDNLQYNPLASIQQIGEGIVR